jgi:hypothetical protein
VRSVSIPAVLFCATTAALPQGCGMRTAEVRQGVHRRTVELGADARAIVAASLGIPAWVEVDYTDREVQALISAAKQVARFDDSALVEAIEHLLAVSSLDPTEQIRHESRIYLLLRVLYAVPDAAGVQRGSFGGWWRPDDVQARRSLQWPLRYSGGALTGVDRFREDSGVGYDAVGELSYFSSRYPRRAQIR